MNKKKCGARLVAIFTAIKRQMPVVAGSSSESVKPLPRTVRKEKDILDTAVPAAHVELSN